MKVVLAALVASVHQSFALQFSSSSTQALAHDMNVSGYSHHPHIIFVLADDLGWNGLGYRNSDIKTPFIDKLASEGVKIDSYYSAVYCAPSRFSFLTGRAGWKSESGSSNFRADIPIGTSTKYKMLPAAFKDAGYATHMIGKWHQGFHTKEYMPRSRGFDQFYGILTQGTDHMTQEVDHPGSVHNCKYEGENGQENIFDFIENDEPVYDIKGNSEFGDDLYRNRAYKLITTHDKTTPLFLYLSLQMPHDPYQVPEEYSSMYNTGNEQLDVYHGMISHLDVTVKTVVAALKEAGMWDNSLVVFSSDNGAPSHRAAAPFNANAPLRGNKGQVYEGAVRVPAFLAGGFLPSSAQGKTLGGIVSIADWYATFARLAGFSVDSGEGLFESDSIDNWDYLSGKSTESARTEMIYHHGPDEGPQSSLHQGKWKLIVSHKSNPDIPMLELFDLSSDPNEEHDVKDDHWEIVEAMSKQLNTSYEQFALKMPWFYIEKLEPSEAQQDKSCMAWQNAKGFLVPWATEVDETDLHFEHINFTANDHGP